MPISDILSNIQDVRKGDGDCQFNGFLEDYIEMIEEDHPLKSLFSQLLEADLNLKICVDLGFDMNKEIISNQIIRYKDASKLPQKYMKCPYIIYGQNAAGNQVGLILYPSGKEDYLIAKGIYYSLTEQGGLLEEARNEVVAMTIENCGQCAEAMERLLNQSTRVGAIQRELDREMYPEFNLLIEHALKRAEEIRTNVTEQLPQIQERSEMIYQTIAQWYLLKKSLYVHYMTNKDLLMSVNENNIKKHRHQAKMFADKVPFIAFSEMWRL